MFESPILHMRRKQIVIFSEFGHGGTLSSWNIGITQTAQVQQQGLVNQLLSLLATVNMTNEDDELVWAEGAADFSVAAGYSKLLRCRLHFFNPGVFEFEWSRVWVNHIPSKVCFFFYGYLLGKGF